MQNIESELKKYQEEKKRTFESIGMRIQDARKNFTPTNENLTSWLSQGWITEADYSRLSGKKILSQGQVGKILSKMEPQNFPHGARSTISNHERGIKLTVAALNIYAKFYRVPVQLFLEDAVLGSDPVYQIDEEKIRKYLYDIREILYTKINEGTVEFKFDSSTVWRWFLPEGADRASKVKTIPLSTYFLIATVIGMNFSALMLQK